MSSRQNNLSGLCLLLAVGIAISAAACKKVAPPPEPYRPMSEMTEPVGATPQPEKLPEPEQEKQSLANIESRGFIEAREQAEKLNGMFTVEEPPYRYYACGFQVVMFPARPEVLERNKDVYAEVAWDNSAFDYDTQLRESKKLWARLDELQGVDTPEELMSYLNKWIVSRASRTDRAAYREKFFEAFENFSQGTLSID